MNIVSSDVCEQQGFCSICRKKLYRPRSNKITLSSVNPCRHLFHTHCIYGWATEHTTCPLGRRAIVSLELQLPLPPGWRTLMFNSARDGQYDQVLGLLKRGAPVDADFPRQHTPFAIAASNKHYSVARLLADHGSTDYLGQLGMGYMLSAGSGVKKDDTRAFEWFAKAADQGFAPAEYLLGLMYWGGKGVLIDRMKAVDWLKKAAAKKLPNAQADLGAIYLIEGSPFTNVPRGLQLLNEAKEGGSPIAMKKLGRMYWQGTQVKVDLPRAQQLLEQAAEKNFIPAKVCLAQYYLELKDKEALPQVITLLQSAADQKSTKAMTLLGTVYKDHLKDPARALELFHQAVKHKDPQGHYELSHMYETGEGVPKDLRQAFIHCREAARQFHTNAQFKLGLMFLRGSFYPEDLDEAEYWLRKAAENGHKEAAEKLNSIQEPDSDSAVTPVKKRKTTQMLADES